MLQDDPSDYTQSRIKSFFDRVQEATIGSTTTSNNNNHNNNNNNNNNNNFAFSFTKPTTSSAAASSASTTASVVKTLPHQPHHQLHQGHGLSPSSSILPNVVVTNTSNATTASSSPSKNTTNKNSKSKEKINSSSKLAHQNQSSSSLTAELSDCEVVTTTSDNFDPVSSDEKRSSNNNNNKQQPVHRHQRRSESNIEFSSNNNNNNRNKKNVQKRTGNLSDVEDDNIQLLDQKAVCLATFPPAPQSKLLNQNNNNNNGYSHHQQNNQQQIVVASSIRGEMNNNTNTNNIQPRNADSSSTTSFQLFKSGPIPLEVIQKHFANRKLKFIRRLGDKLYLAQKQQQQQQQQQQRINNSTNSNNVNNNNNNNGGDFICSYVLTIQDVMFANQLKEQYRTDSRHPGSVVVISAVKHSDGIVEVETEYCDVGPLERLYQYFSPPTTQMPISKLFSPPSESLPQKKSHPTTVTNNALLHPLASFVAAKSISRQILLALHTFNLVHNRVHRGVSPRTILVRRDGTVKLGIFDAMVKADFAVSNSYPQEFWRSVYCAPECRYSTLFGNSYSTLNNNNNNQNNNDTDTSSILQMMNTAVDNFFKISDSSKADMWSVGMVILSLILGETFFSSSSSSSSSTTRNSNSTTTTNEESWKILEKLGLATSSVGSNGNRNNNGEENNNNLASNTPTSSLPAENNNNNNNAEKIFERVASTGATMNTYTSANFSQVDPTINELWAHIIPDAPLRYLTRRCLEVDPKKRISVSEATALTFIFGRTQGFRQKVFEELLGCVDKYCVRGDVDENTSSDDSNDDYQSGKEASEKGEKKSVSLSQELIDAGLRWKNEQTDSLPSWARYTECPFSMPDFIPSLESGDENVDGDDEKEKTKPANQNQENNHSNNINAMKEENSKTPIERQLTQEVIGNNNTSGAASTNNSNNNNNQQQQPNPQQHLHTSSKKEEIVSLSDVIATSQISKLLGEETIAKETKLLSSLPSCCGGCVQDSPSAHSIISPAPSVTTTPAVSPASSLNFNASLQFQQQIQQQIQQQQQQQFLPTSSSSLPSFLSSPPSTKPSNPNMSAPVLLTGALSLLPPPSSVNTSIIAASPVLLVPGQSPSRFEEVNIQKYQRRVSTLLDLELQSQLTKRLNHPGGILSIEKQMREVMRSRVLPATKSLKAIVNEIAVLKKQEKK